MKRVIAAMLACLMLAGCADDDISTTENASQTKNETTAATTQTTTTTAKTTMSSATTAASTASEPEESLSIRESITYETVSDGHIFVDFDYITDYDKSSVLNVPDEITGKALEAVKETDDYKASQRELPNYKNNGIDEYLGEDGELQPIMRYAFREDFDNSGSDEWFLLYDIPIFSSYLPDSFQGLSILVYTNGEDVKVMTAYQGITEISLLDYGLCRQLLICGNGTYGAGCHSEIFGVKYGRPVEHYKFRGVFYKQDCFIAAHGWQGMGDFMYYDTYAQEYRAIKGKEITKAKLQKMDSKNSLADIFSEYDEMSVYPCANVIGGKYYLIISDFFMDIGTPYTYENGEFVPCGEDCPVRISRCHLINSVEDIDYDEAIASMVKPEEAIKQKQAEELSSDGHIFVDFSYIENYEGTRDIAECGEWYDMAVEAVIQTDTYREQNTALKSIATSDIEFRYEVNMDIKDYLDENGNIIPLLGEAFIEDYDNNGTDECFMRLIIPFSANEKELWELHNFLVYCGDSCEILSESQGISFSLLDYGLCKQLAAEEYSHGYNISPSYYLNIYGVVQGKAEKLFYSFSGETVKKDCFLEIHVYQQPFDDLVYYDTVKEQYQYASSANVSYDDAVSSMLSPAEAAVVHNAL